MRRRECLGSLGGIAGAVLPVTLLPQQARAQTASCAELLSERYDEFQLVSRRLTVANLEGLQLWDGNRRSWQKQPLGHAVVRSRIMVLHFWADYCGPCRREFPLLKELAHELLGKYPGKIQLTFVSDTNSAEAMVKFLDQNQAALPWGDGPHYLDTDGRLRQLLGGSLPNGTLSLPATLLCDPFIVRQGLIGSLSQRRTELRAAIERLLQTFVSTP